MYNSHATPESLSCVGNDVHHILFFRGGVMETTSQRLFLNWKQAREVIGIARNLQHEYREAGILQWTPVGGNGKKPLVFYTLEQLNDFVRYLKEYPLEAARRLQEWRRERDKKRAEKLREKKRLRKG